MGMKEHRQVEPVLISTLTGPAGCCGKRDRSPHSLAPRIFPSSLHIRDISPHSLHKRVHHHYHQFDDFGSIMETSATMPTATQSASGLFQCGDCKRSYTRMEHLARHIRSREIDFHINA